jgi:hypothetical protein
LFEETATESEALDHNPRTLPPRLAYGQIVVLNRILVSLKSAASFSDSAKLTFYVQRRHATDLNSLVSDVRGWEKDISQKPGSRISRHTFHRQIASVNVVEFEYVAEHPFGIVRHVYLQTGEFLLHFIFDAPNAEFRPRFEEFLGSIRLNSVCPRVNANSR